MTYHLIATHQGTTPVKWMCQALGVSESGYYAWKRRSPSHRSQENQVLAERIAQVYQASRRISGSLRIQAELRSQGHCCSRKRIARLMRQGGLSARRKAQRAHTTDSQHANPLAPNRLNRELSAQRPNEKWVTDLTGVRTGQGWLSPFGRTGSLLAQSDRLGGGAHPAATAAWVAASFGSGQPVHEQRLSGTPLCLGDRGQHEPQGRLLRQRLDGKLLCDLEGGVCRSPTLAEPRPCAASDL